MRIAFNKKREKQMDWKNLGMQAANTATQGVIGTALGLATAKWQDRRQIRQQKKLQKMQIQGQKEMGIFNREQAMQMWHDTNYAAQRAEMEKAGLNVGLMYGMGGPGGASTSTQAGNVTGASAQGGEGEIATAMQMGINLQLLKAQKENIEADTTLKQATAAKTAGVDTAQTAKQIESTTASIEQMKQNTANAKIQEEILNFEKGMKKIEAEIQRITQQEIITKIHAERDILMSRAIQEAQKAKEDQATVDAKIKQINQATIEQGLRIQGMKLGLNLTEEQINKVSQEITASMVGLAQSERKLRLDEIMTKYNIGGEEKRTSETVTNYTGQIIKLIDAILPN